MGGVAKGSTGVAGGRATEGTGGTVHGIGAVEMALRHAGKGYVPGVKATDVFASWIGKPPVNGTAEAIAEGRAPPAWQRLSAGDGTKGPRLYDWSHLELADLDAAAFDGLSNGLWTRGLLIRRSISDGERAYFSTWCPAGTSLQTLAAVEGHRWAVEDGFEMAKTELGLDHNGQAASDRLTRSWHGWHRHVSLVMLAFAMLAAIRHRANRGREKNQRPRLRNQIQSLDPLAGAGNSPHRHAPGATAD
jgi:SRSO17 transposase